MKLFPLKPGEFRLIRSQSILFGCALALALACVLLALWYQGQALQAQQQMRDQLQQARAEAASMQQDRQDFERYGRAYRDLIARGVIGEEDRLQRVEALTSLNRDHPEMKLKYRIEARRPLDFVPDTPDGMRVFASRMHLRLTVAHEAQLLSVLSRLDQDAHGLHLLRQCEMRRSKLDDQQTDWVAPPLEAACVIEWVTLRKADAPAPSADGSQPGGNG